MTFHIIPGRESEPMVHQHEGGSRIDPSISIYKIVIEKIREIETRIVS